MNDTLVQSELPGARTDIDILSDLTWDEYGEKHRFTPVTSLFEGCTSDWIRAEHGFVTQRTKHGRV